MLDFSAARESACGATRLGSAHTLC
eukprot:COSAG06_NODE_54998_length_291_cov_88.182292_1_plen_24_part_10